VSHNSPQIQESSSSDDRWYVSRNEKEYGPLPFGDLAQHAKQGSLLESDWIWKPGLPSWVAAGEVSGLFSEPSPQSPNQNTRELRKEPESKPTFKTRAKEQIRDFAVMSLYLWIVFGMMAIHESIILSQHQINYIAHGFAVVNALVFAKVMLVAQDFNLGHRLHDKPLIYAVIFKSLLFAIALICFHVVEHVLIGMWDGKPIAQSIAEVGADKLVGIVSLGIISTVALAPFFLLSEISRVIGRDNFWALFFQRRTLK
jgi:hypothetical protein